MIEWNPAFGTKAILGLVADGFTRFLPVTRHNEIAQNYLLKACRHCFCYIIPLRYRHLLSTRVLRYNVGPPFRRLASKRARSLADQIDSRLEKWVRKDAMLSDQNTRATIKPLLKEATKNY